MDKLKTELKSAADSLSALFGGARCSAGFDARSGNETAYYNAMIGTICATGETLEQAIENVKVKHEAVMPSLEKEAAAAGYKLVKIEEAK
jgi:hypothetical protein